MNEETSIEPQRESDSDTSPFANRWAMLKAAFWHELDSLRYLTHLIAPFPVLIFLYDRFGIWFAVPATCAIVALSIFWPPGRFTIFDSMPGAKSMFSVFFAACLLLTNTLAACGVTGLAAHEMGLQGRLLLVAGVSGGIGCIILSVVLQTPFRELFHISPELKALIRNSMNDDEPSDPPKDRASRFGNGKSSSGPR